MDFALLFARVLHHYNVGGHRGLLTLPMKTFWMLNKNITRLRAEMDLRALQVAISSQGGEGAAALQEKLIVEFDNPYKVDQASEAFAERDEAGFNDLKRMARGM